MPRCAKKSLRNKPMAAERFSWIEISELDINLQANFYGAGGRQLFACRAA